MKESKFEKLKTSSELKEKEPIVDIKIDEETEKEIFEKYEDLKFLIDSIGMEYEELTEEEIKQGLEQAPEGAGYSIDPESFGLDIDGPEEREKVQKVILKNVFKQIGFDPEMPKLIKDRKEKVAGRKVSVKYFEIENPDLVLSFDGIYWCLESKKP